MDFWTELWMLSAVSLIGAALAIGFAELLVASIDWLERMH